MTTTSQRRSRKQEARVAKDLGASVQPGSGAPEFYKGDVRKTGELRVECKTTSKKSYALKLSEIEKIKVEALKGGGESWAMQIEFQGAVKGRRFAVIDWQEFLDLVEMRSKFDTEQIWREWAQGELDRIKEDVR